jgi:FkbM family methyltransferase
MEALLTAPVGKKGLGTAYRLTNRYLLPGETYCRAEIAEDTWMRVSTFEPYWAPVTIGQRPYEPEIRHVVELAASLLDGREWAFLDCGANFGYWSAIVSSPEIGCRRVAAVEANPSTFAKLEETRQLNQHRFRAFHVAISDTCGDRVYIQDFGPKAHAMARATEEPVGAPVVTSSIDGLIRQLRWEDAAALIIKLDVEGHEAKALAGARRMRRTIAEHMFIYEDHGSEAGCANTAAFLGEGYAVFHVTREGAVQPVYDLDAVRKVKLNPVRGYNFVAVPEASDLHSGLMLPGAHR